MNEYDLITLPNGIRVVHKHVTHTKIAHCGIMLDIGSRDENPNQQGLAHFWEHMAFKGTQKRKAFHIINRLESLGGELNAYTTKEKICFYASILDTHFDKSVELLTDITFNSVFPEKQIEKEKQVILEEMSMYQDSPEDAIQDEMDELIFAGHQLGNNILGNTDSVKSFQKADFIQFLAENIDTGKIVFSIVGNVPIKKVVRIAEKYLGHIANITSVKKRIPVNGYTPCVKNQDKDIVQSHCAIGKRAFHIYEKERIPFFVLNNILGGQSMNSRLNLTLREKYGLVYGIESSYQPYTDTGMFSVFYGTEPDSLERSIELTFKEIKKLQDKVLGSGQLQTAKNQIKGQLAMSEENYNSIMLMMAKSLLDLNRIQSLDSVFEKIDLITGSELQDLAVRELQRDDMSILTYTPK
ncbi:pitrilysin family protein [Reichenbachiella sp. MALMAid0571]|uniref:M16 family metallopeptidase n=1 Tax=Reichenbachiella sp. MALMAid0571 TaxID=3143939 RepID=UPI0032DF9BA5